MSQFLELLETLRAEDASVSRLFGDAGTSMRRMPRNSPKYRRMLAEAAELVEGVYSGRRPTYHLQEAMSVDDFPLLFGDILDRQLLGMYQEWPTQWSMIARRSTVRDFRTVNRFVTDGAEAILSAVPPGSEYPEAAISEARYQYAVSKYGRRVPLLWETWVNDDLDGLRSIPERLAKAARMSEEKFVTALYAASTGPNGTFFSSGNKNIVTTGTANPAFSITALEAAFSVIWAQRDADGNPIFTGPLRLVVPPALAVAARNVLNSTEIRVALGSGSSLDQITAKNWMSGEISELIINPWLPIVSTTNGNTSWYLFADPGVGRPAVEVGFLRGNESPALFVKSPDAVRVGGGSVSPEEGDFDTDGINYRVRHVFGGVLMEPKAAFASNGTNS
jgi:hypothetical protein